MSIIETRKNLDTIRQAFQTKPDKKRTGPDRGDFIPLPLSSGPELRLRIGDGVDSSTIEVRVNIAEDTETGFEGLVLKMIGKLDKEGNLTEFNTAMAIMRPDDSDNAFRFSYNPDGALKEIMELRGTSHSLIQFSDLPASLSVMPQIVNLLEIFNHYTDPNAQLSGDQIFQFPLGPFQLITV